MTLTDSIVSGYLRRRHIMEERRGNPEKDDWLVEIRYGIRALNPRDRGALYSAARLCGSELRNADRDRTH